MRKLLLAGLFTFLALPGLQGAASAQPAQEPAAVAQLRRLLGPGARLTYGSATATDADGGAALTAVVLTRPSGSIRIAEARLEGLRDDGIARLSLREIELVGGRAPATLGRLDLEGLTVRRPGGGAAPRPDDVTADLLRLENWRSAGDTPVNIGAVTVENFGGDRASRVNATALEMGFRAGGFADRLAVARIAADGFDMADLLSAIMDQRPPATRAGSSSFDVESASLTQRGTVIARLGALTMRGEAAPGQPDSGTLALRGLEVNAAPPHAEWMRRLGYASLRAEARMEATRDASTGVLDIPVLNIELRDAGELNLALRLDNVPEQTDPQNMAEIRLISARLRYADLSLFQRWIRAAAERDGVPEGSFRQRLVEQAGAMLNGPRLADARSAMQRFLRGEASVLELTANPRSPLAMTMVQRKPPGNLAGWQDMLGLTLTAR